MRQTLLLLVFVLAASTCWAKNYDYISPADLKAKIESGAPLLLVDIQAAKEFAQHHIKGALATYAYPVKSDEDRARLAPVLERAQTGAEPIVIVCPRGAGGAKRAYDFLQESGVATERLNILEGGQQGWPYPELLVQQ